jgi:5-methyltetrahydrofolate--homocysteine methyltransferase
MGTMLQSYGLTAGICPEEWNFSHPQVITKIHQAYLAAGADIIETNTFGGNRIRLEFQGYGESVSLFNSEAAELARAVCPADKFIAGSVGPTGEFLEPLGTHTKEHLENVFKEQIEALLAVGIDLLIIETMSDITEACTAIRAARVLNQDIPIFTTMTFEKRESGYRTMMGASPLDMITPFREAGADVLGANCGTGMEDMIPIIQSLRDKTDMPLMAQANAGLPVEENGHLSYKEIPLQRAKKVKTLLDLGVNIVGGCCGTTPQHIKATSEVVEEYNQRKKS